MPRGKKPTCDLCCDTLDKGQDILKCEGDCGCTVHRYCAGVTKRRYEELMKSTGGTDHYVCEWCSLKTTRAIIQQLQCEVANLKQELAEAKALAAQQATSPELETAPSTRNITYAAAAAHCLQSAGGHHNSTAANRGRRARQGAGPTQARPGVSAGSNRDRRRERVPVEGVRRVWNTYIHSTTKSIENAISRFCKLKVEGLRIKRKTRTNELTGKLNWWYVIHSEESTLCELENKWEPLQTQTSWVLERCTKPADDTNASSDHTTTNSDPSPASTNSDPQEEDDEGSSNGTGSTTITSPTPNLMDPTATDHHAGDADQISDHEHNADQTSDHEHNTNVSFLQENPHVAPTST